MSNTLKLCMNECKEIVQTIIDAKNLEMKRIFMKHMDNIGSKHLVDIISAYKNNEMSSVIKIARVIIKEPEFKKKLLLLLDDIIVLYKNNQVNINKIVKCFISHCDKDSINLLHESYGMIFDLFNLLNDLTIKNKMDEIQKSFIANLKYTDDLISNSKKSSSNKSSSKKSSSNKSSSNKSSSNKSSSNKSSSNKSSSNKSSSKKSSSKKSSS
jgi:hypothetical protein